MRNIKCADCAEYINQWCKKKIDSPYPDLLRDCEYYYDKDYTGAWQKLYNKLIECQLFCGVYDAGNGDKHFMYGIGTVMEAIAYYAGVQEEFSDMFYKNLAKSEGENGH